MKGEMCFICHVKSLSLWCELRELEVLGLCGSKGIM
jgi:hypothetical protein